MKNYITLVTSVLVLILAVTFKAQAQKTDQQITFEALSTKTYGDLPFNLTAAATSGLPVQFESSNTLVATVSGNTVTILGAGQTVITASQPGDDNFNPALSVQQTLVVDKSNQTITFGELPVKTYGEDSFFLSASATSGLPISYSSSNPGVATIVGNSVVINGAGECTITASQTGNSNYHSAQPVERVLKVDKATQFISLGSLIDKTYGDEPFSLTATSSSGLPVYYNSNSPLIFITGNQITILGAGAVEITASQSGNANYLPAEEVVRTLTINKAPQTITFNPISQKTFGDLPFTLTALTNSGLPITFSSQYDSLLTITGNIGTIIGAGSLNVYATQPGNENYLPKTVDQTLIINKAPQTITFLALPTKKFGDGPFSISASSISGLPVSFSSNRKTVARVSGNTVTIVGAGTAPIVASQLGNANYLAAPNVIQPLVVTALGNSYPIMGITRSGGNGRGTIFNINTSGSDFVIQKNFSSNAFNAPQSGLIKGSDGKLYGMIMAGGAPSNGVVFSILPDGTQYSILHNFNFTTGQRPFGNVMEASNGYLYGMTYDGGVNNTGVLFKISKDGSGFSKLYEFPGFSTGGSFHPLGGLIEASDGAFYGMTAEGGAGGYGVLFAIKKDGAGYTNLVEFGGVAKGSAPRGDVLQGPDGYLYGLTASGGNSNFGVLFKVKTDGTDFIKLVDFDGATKGSYPGATLILGNDGKLYGMTRSGGSQDKGVIFSVNTDGTSFAKLFDFDGQNSGTWSHGKLVQSSDNYLYGMTNQGGTSDLGVAFKIKTDGTDFTKLIDFNGSNGASPVYGPLLEVEPGKFFGMTSKGGASSTGIIFSITSSGNFAKVKEFPQPEGTPEVLSASDGNHFFGVASSGGPTGNGAIFKTSANGGDYEKIHDLEGNVLFVNRLIQTSDNFVWGAGNEGVFTVTSILFRLNSDGTNFQRFTFDDAPGLSVSQLIEGPDQFLYGTGYMNGGSSHGIIFRFKTDGTNFSKLADIPGGSGGSRPTENLILTEDGILFGLTHEGGTNNDGTVFRFNIHTLQFSSIFSLHKPTTGTYLKRIALLNDGSLCVATATGGTNDSGTIFSISQDGNDFNKILDFSSSLNLTDIIQTVDGYLVGTTEYGGTSNSGIIFETLTDGSNFKNIFEFTGANGSNPEQIFFRKTNQVITFNELASKQFNDPAFALSASNSSGLPITFSSSNESIASINGNVVSIHGVGEVTITANTTGNINFTSVQVQRTLVITKDDQTITFDSVDDLVVGSAAFSLSGVASSGLPVEFSSNSSRISLTGNTVAVLSPGSVTIDANQAGDSYYNAAPLTQQTFCINPSRPTITTSEVTLETAILTSSQLSGNQWFRNGELLPHETSASISIFEEGSYTVVTSVDGCSSEPSEAYVMVITVVDEEGKIEFIMYPNPGSDKIKLDLSTFTQTGTIDIHIFDSQGKQIQQLTSTNHSEIELDISSLDKGAYILKVSCNGSNVMKRFIKK